MSFTEHEHPSAPVPEERELVMDSSSEELSPIGRHRSTGSQHSFQSEPIVDQMAEIQLQIQQMVPKLAQSIAKMDLTSPEVLRTTRAYRVFEHRALALRGMEKDLFYKSQRSHKITTFWSHSWHGGRWRKIFTLLFLYNSRAASLCGMLAACVSFFLYVFELLPGFYRNVYQEQVYSCWCFSSGVVVTCLVMLLWKPQSHVFVDRICISQNDHDLKTQAIFSLAGLLKASDSMLILWDPTWTDRLWCLFELAAFLKTKNQGKQELLMVPTFMGPVSMSVFMAICLGLLPVLLTPVDGTVPSFLLPAGFVMLQGLGTAFITVSTLRQYFRDLDVMKDQLRSLSFDQTRSACCDCNHVSDQGQALICDRKVVKECVNLWFGSQEAFENLVRSEVQEILSRDLELVFTYKWVLGLTMPGMWTFLDLAATFCRRPINPKVDHEHSVASGLRFLLQGLAVYFMAVPCVKDLLILICRLMRHRPQSQVLEAVKNLCGLLLIGLPVVIVVSLYILSWTPFIMPTNGPMEKAVLFIGLMLLFSICSLLLTRLVQCSLRSGA